MKLLGFLLMLVGLVVGAVAATSAYVPLVPENINGFTYLVDGETTYLTLNAPAGKRDVQGEADPQPIAEPGTELTAEVVAELRAAGVIRVRVKEFSFGRWTGKYYFLMAIIGLTCGAMMVRMATKAAVLKALSEDRHEVETPEFSLTSLGKTVKQLLTDLPGLPDDHARLEAIIARIGHAQGTQMAAFVEAKPLLLGKFGLSGYASIMDTFAGAERQLNRAWSAAADGVYSEAITCLNRATTLLEETEAKVRGLD